MTKQNLKIFVISLQECGDRRAFMIQQLNKLEIEFEFFDAITPTTIPERIANKINDKFRKIFRSRPLSPGQKGCYVSHYCLWEKCIEIDRPIIILEDDCFVLNSFKDFVARYQESTKELNYLSLEKHQEINGIINSEKFVYADVASGTRGYYLTPFAAQAFLKKSHRIDRAVDNFIADGYLHQIPSFRLKNFVIKDQDGEFITTIGTGQKSRKVPFIFKITRELYRCYRFIRNFIWRTKVRFSTKSF